MAINNVTELSTPFSDGPYPCEYWNLWKTSCQFDRRCPCAEIIYNLEYQKRNYGYKI